MKLVNIQLINKYLENIDDLVTPIIIKDGKIIVKPNKIQFDKGTYDINQLLFGYKLNYENLENIEYKCEIIFLYNINTNNKKNIEERNNHFHRIFKDEKIDEKFSNEKY